ncbi:F-box/kelch-repeat protein At1g57790-like [Quercus lobata]|uniref:F-box protein n=1 Tax=Quercus lobata TaxID=97700 RepID=A0A7N2R349_QUELO|nr:F-box/kelch-repeat protein At1g57790-like [Quercus lobata]
MAKQIVRYSTEDQENQENKKGLHRSWSHLPPELLCLVSSYLLAGDFTTFRVICKSWRSSTSLPRPAVSTLTDSPWSLSPCLMSVGSHKCTFFHPGYQKHDACEIDIPELLDARIRFSKYGWLLLTGYGYDNFSVFFFNPFTKEKVELPKYTNRESFVTMSFSSPPTSSDCFVIGICGWDDFGFIKRGEKRWTSHTIINRPEFTPSSYCNPILHKGLCNCLGENGGLGVFDPNDNPSNWIIYHNDKIPLIQEKLDSVHRSYLVESDEGKLLAIFMVEEGDTKTPIHVFELPKLQVNKNMLKPRKIVCRIVRSLGNRILYISLGGSFLGPVVPRGLGNQIYLPIVQDQKNIYYSLSTGKYHFIFDDYSAKNIHRLEQPMNCCWIQGRPKLTLNKDFEW